MSLAVRVYLLAPVWVRVFCTRIQLALTCMVSGSSDASTRSSGFWARGGTPTIMVAGLKPFFRANSA